MIEGKESNALRAWLNVKLGNVVTLVNGRAYKQEEMLAEGTPILRIQNLNGGDRWFYSNLQLPAEKYCDSGDLLYAWSATFGPFIYSGPKAIFHYHIWNVLPSLAIDKKFAFYELLRVTDKIKRSAHGVAMPHVTKSGMEAWSIELPPIAEQKRIADKLDAVLARVDAVNTRLALVAPIIKRFRQSVLAVATSGRLTQDWRTKYDAANWKPRTVESLCLHIGDGPFGSNLKSDDYTEHGARVVRLENIGHLNFEFNKKTFISLEKYETLKKHTLVDGDLLFSSFVDEEVRVCEFPEGISEPTINKADCFCLRVDAEQVNRRFLAFRLACRTTYEDLKAQVHGATRPRINLSQLRGFNVDLPSLEEQAEIVRRVENLFAFAARLEKRLETAQTATERLTPSLLAKAFRGELVPQDPNDEPASELLRRLAQNAPASPSRSRRKAATTV
jgi:type I restriction enzyme, S subunit